MLSLVVARARNGAIGKDNLIPWYAPEDLALFKRETTGGALIMGRKTWQSLPFKPLKNRLNCVVSSDSALTEHVFATPESALSFARAQGHARSYGIGGEGIFRALLPLADRLLITEIDLEIAEADAFFPDFDAADWRQLPEMLLRADGPRCVLTEYLRR
ncbi:MAG: dihydrofolate reductase [Cypionkella sp.]|uniref:dihydrofolate reductase n=1 Tax=Cypionkella sp. TaxID=2811411 RepID=UPI002627BDA6|nr:dihydrofolate reductase [Cypionkella sp.]MDB5660044.1 dihydrofolate reductase [Cypionkella sp.]MDB5664083.1 dihydrofolate reductase [Cypionkella sp.]